MPGSAADGRRLLPLNADEPGGAGSSLGPGRRPALGNLRGRVKMGRTAAVRSDPAPSPCAVIGSAACTARRILDCHHGNLRGRVRWAGRSRPKRPGAITVHGHRLRSLYREADLRLPSLCWKYRGVAALAAEGQSPYWLTLKAARRAPLSCAYSGFMGRCRVALVAAGEREHKGATVKVATSSWPSRRSCAQPGAGPTASPVWRRSRNGRA